MRPTVRLLALSLAILLAAVAAPASAHQPFFEEIDIKATAPWQIKDPTVSTVVYATLESAGDIDYFAFEGQAGQRILLEITIPQITGQELFAPTMALLGQGLPEADNAALPAALQGTGAIVIEPTTGPAPTFFEPFSRTSYWERQSARVPLPESGRYTVAVWHPDGQVGRYGFVIGDKERMGGDLLGLATKLSDYWTPVEAAVPAAEDPSAEQADHDHDGHDHDHNAQSPQAPGGYLQWWQFKGLYAPR